LPTIAVNSATPHINFPSNLVKTLNTAVTNITSFPNAIYNGPEIIVQCGDTLTTFVNNTQLLMIGSVNQTCTFGKIFKFKLLGWGGVTMQTQ
jgi:hypothetical protein